jgi:Glutathione S-transferase, C-terminal domain
MPVFAPSSQCNMMDRRVSDASSATGSPPQLLLKVLETRLDGRSWIMGDEYSIADISLLGWVRLGWVRHMARSTTRSNQRPDTLMHDRSSPDRRKPLVTHGRTYRRFTNASFATSI